MKKIMIAAVVALLGINTAHAAKFGVKVVSESGEPLAGIAVCVGTHGNYKQFGALFTSSNGNAVVDVPNVPLIVTISKNRFTAVRITEPARNFNLVKEIKLKEGIPGPRCRAGSTMVEGKSGFGEHKYAVRIDDVHVKDSVFSVTLETSVIGDPSHYRVSESSTFDGTNWLDFKSEIDLQGSMVYSNNVFLQMRKYKELGGGWVEARSNVVNVDLPK